VISYEALRTILIMSITGSVLALILFALKPLVRNRLPKMTQYYLWLMVLAVLVMPISRLIVLPDITPNMPTISKTVNQYVVSNQDILERLKPYEVENKDGVMGIPESGMAEVERLVPSTWAPEAVDWFRLIHYLGVAAYLAFILFSYTAFTRKIERHNAAAAEEEKAMLAGLCGNKRVPLLYRNPLAATPMLIGVFRPAIILPDREYTETRLNAVLLHELTHLRRKDVLVKWFAVLVTAVHWFNPIVWAIRREIDRACELSCDVAVILNFDADSKQRYGETLIFVAADSKTPHAILSTTMCEEKKALKERLGSIMKSKKHTWLAIALSVILVIAVGGTAIALGAGSRSSDNSDNSAYQRIAALIGSPQEEVYRNIGNPHETLNGIDNFTINGKTVHITYDENNRVNHINFNGEFVVNAPDLTNDGIIKQLPPDDVRALAAKGDALQNSDLPNLSPSTLSSIMVDYTYDDSDSGVIFSLMYPKSWSLVEQKAWKGDDTREGSPDSGIQFRFTDTDVFGITAMLYSPYGFFGMEQYTAEGFTIDSGLSGVKYTSISGGHASVIYIFEMNGYDARNLDYVSGPPPYYFASVNMSEEVFMQYKADIEKVINSLDIAE